MLPFAVQIFLRYGNPLWPVMDGERCIIVSRHYSSPDNRVQSPVDVGPAALSELALSIKKCRRITDAAPLKVTLSQALLPPLNPGALMEVFPEYVLLHPPSLLERKRIIKIDGRLSSSARGRT